MILFLGVEVDYCASPDAAFEQGGCDLRKFIKGDFVDHAIELGGFEIGCHVLPEFAAQFHWAKYRVDAEQVDSTQDEWEDGGVDG